MLAVIVASLLLLFPLSAGAHEDALRARVLFLPEGFSGRAISPDGSSVVGVDADLGGGAVWRRGVLRPLERDPANRVNALPIAASRRARVTVAGGLAPGVNVWRRGHRTLLAPFGEGADVSANGRVIVGFVRDPVAGDIGTRWLKGAALPITGQDGFEALSGRAVSASGRTIFGVGSFDGGAPTRFLWRRGRATEVEGLSDAIRDVDDLPFFVIHSMQLSSDGTTAVHADVVDEVSTCSGNVCVVDVDFEAWRWRNGELELLDDTRESESIPSGITANGEVIVGSASLAEGTGPFLWDATHGLRNLTGLLESLGADLQGLVLHGVSGISDDGRRIIGLAGDVTLRRVLVTYLAILPPACSDRVDNDGDGRVDFPEDRGCRSRSDEDENGRRRRHRRGR